MDTQLQTRPAAKPDSAATTLLGVLAAVLIAAVFTNISAQLPLISNDRIACVILAVLGLGMCTTGGIGVTLQKRGWKDGMTIVGSVLGALALALTVAVLVGLRLPLIATDRDAFMALASIGACKVILRAIDSRRG